MSNESECEEPPVSFYPCARCGTSVPAERAFALMETLEVLCRECLRKTVRGCESCGKPVGPGAYQHFPSGKVLYEPCVLKEIRGQVGPPA